MLKALLYTKEVSPGSRFHVREVQERDLGAGRQAASAGARGPGRAWAFWAFWAGVHSEVRQLIRTHKVIFAKIFVSLFVTFSSITGQ